MLPRFWKRARIDRQSLSSPAETGPDPRALTDLELPDEVLEHVAGGLERAYPYGDSAQGAAADTD